MVKTWAWPAAADWAQAGRVRAHSHTGSPRAANCDHTRSLLIAQAFNRVEGRGLAGRVVARSQAHRHADKEAQHHGGPGHEEGARAHEQHTALPPSTPSRMPRAPP